jgi:hypothetical protein
MIKLFFKKLTKQHSNLNNKKLELINNNNNNNKIY